MNALEKLYPDNTKGVCTADVIKDPDVNKFEAKTLTFAEDKVYQRWVIHAHTSSASVTQTLAFYIPFGDDVTDREFKIVDAASGPDTMQVDWQEIINGEIHRYIGFEGKAIVSIDKSAATLTARFDFKADRASNVIEIARGKLSVEGFSHDTGSVTADVTGDVTASYRATEVTLIHQPASRTFPPSFRGWSLHYEPRPNIREFQLSLSVADHLKPGTYSVTRDSQEVRIIFFDMRKRFLGYWATEGTVNIQKMPASDASSGELTATFDFTAKTEAPEHVIKAINGHLHIKK